MSYRGRPKPGHEVFARDGGVVACIFCGHLHSSLIFCGIRPVPWVDFEQPLIEADPAKVKRVLNG